MDLLVIYQGPICSPYIQFFSFFFCATPIYSPIPKFIVRKDGKTKQGLGVLQFGEEDRHVQHGKARQSCGSKGIEEPCCFILRLGRPYPFCSIRPLLFLRFQRRAQVRPLSFRFNYYFFM